ncbi:hypothetical protein C2845_PM04G09330 [Panicum miliaceum]|uniref:Alpha-galactosidase n=1 Tax=Panicum miliaceum TaxID=4540 RepID=A0A3L6QPM9_PANMI|nr:hypothetical protein C2845_PM04G09330 [Panicum miliaceum]
MDPQQPEPVSYLCGDCGAENTLKPGDVIQCRECGYRILYKKRTRRMPIDGASRTLPAIRVSARVGTGAPDPTVHGTDGARDKLSARASTGGARRALLANGLGLTPQMGWSSWNHFQCDINETVVRSTADALVATGLARAGYTYVNLGAVSLPRTTDDTAVPACLLIADDCWADYQRTKKGYMVANPKAFPSGIKALADYVHGKGLKLGLYSSAGTRTCSDRMPGSLGHENTDAKTFASWVHMLQMFRVQSSDSTQLLFLKLLLKPVLHLKYDNCYRA